MEIYRELDNLKAELDSYRPLSPELLEAIDEKFKIEWTYNSNAIEGNTLTLQETSYFLQHGLTSKGKTLKEYLEAQNHAEAIEWVKEIIKQERPVAEGLIKELHALLMRGMEYVWTGPRENRVKMKITPGKYKLKLNHVVTMNGKIHKYCEPVRVPEAMAKLVEYINTSRAHPVELAATAHYKLVAIHPFDDGNGRVARLLMNLIIMQNGFLPVVIKKEKREDYYRALAKADDGDLEDFIDIIAREEKSSLQLVINVIKQQ